MTAGFRPIFTPETNLYNIEKTKPELFMENKQLKTTPPDLLKEIMQNQGPNSGGINKHVKNSYFYSVCSGFFKSKLLFLPELYAVTCKS